MEREIELNTFIETRKKQLARLVSVHTFYSNLVAAMNRPVVTLAFERTDGDLSDLRYSPGFRNGMANVGVAMYLDLVGLGQQTEANRIIHRAQAHPKRFEDF